MKLSNDFPVFSDSLPIFNPRLEKCSSVSVVGNSGGLFSSGYGNQIDDADTVIRMNAAPVEGYEEDVGEKTDYRFINGLLQKGKTLSYTTTPGNWIETLSEENLVFMPVSGKSNQRGRELAGDENQIHIAKEQFASYIKDELRSFFGNYPSSGIIGSVIGILIADTEVNMYGVGFHQNPSDKAHYWEDWDRQNTSHNWNKERQTMKLLEKEVDKFHIVR